MLCEAVSLWGTEMTMVGKPFCPSPLYYYALAINDPDQQGTYRRCVIAWVLCHVKSFEISFFFKPSKDGP